ncbi:FitA-like ribbon-helix-helix domain-containing protein [Hyphomonas sp.]|uniref:FitA-like ribbon-helix-helix domain-containing protein n=1 Tax=Hyphomonas sp. TaxID=87 RepID=UPI00391B5672
MASITIRRLDDRVKEALRLRAARNGRSMEEEARDILESTLTPPKLSAEGLRAISEKLAALRAPGAPSLVDELIAERRAEAARE